MGSLKCQDEGGISERRAWRDSAGLISNKELPTDQATTDRPSPASQHRGAGQA